MLPSRRRAPTRRPGRRVDVFSKVTKIDRKDATLAVFPAQGRQQSGPPGRVAGGRFDLLIRPGVENYFRHSGTVFCLFQEHSDIWITFISPLVCFGIVAELQTLLISSF